MRRARGRGGSVRVAAVDIGTVTTRLLVADVRDGRLDEVLRRSEITHLGEGLDASGRLTADAVRRVVEAVAGYAADAERLGVERTVALATSAARDAANAETLLGPLAGLGIRPKVIPGDREAALSFLGATYEMDGEGILVADPGGGSTELVYGAVERSQGARRVRIDAARSIDVGARRMTERYLHSDPPTPAELEAARAWAVAEFRPYFDALRERPEVLVTLAGTATTLAAVKQGLDPYDSSRIHGFELTGADVADGLEMFAALPLAERRGIVGLEPARASVIVGGTLVIEIVMSLAGVDSTLVSEHDILYGIALDAAASEGPGR
ncbi:MAG: exopolyphosphatase [Coriobacteriaceae bacterium]|nr:exopolyphosphatase [Coriobacteriaceae bacterium]